VIANFDGAWIVDELLVIRNLEREVTDALAQRREEDAMGRVAELNARIDLLELALNDYTATA
jgi:hypothetical protein